MKKAPVNSEKSCQTVLGVKELVSSDRSRNSERLGKAMPLTTRTEVSMGTLTGFDASGLALVKFAESGTREALRARSTVTLSFSQIGSEVVLVFEEGNLAKPIVMGCIQSKNPVEPEQFIGVKLDGEELTLSADREIVLRCGKASITLTRAGKILICGAYVLSRSFGVNRIKGASVQIN